MLRLAPLCVPSALPLALATGGNINTEATAGGAPGAPAIGRRRRIRYTAAAEHGRCNVAEINDNPRTARQRGKTAPAKLAHVVLRSAQADKVAQWYETVLEAEVTFRDDRLCFLTYDDEHHRIAVINMPGLPSPGGLATGVEHFAFTYACADDLFATYERLREQSILPYWCINHGLTLSFYYRDPDNNQVELQIDLFDGIREVSDWMRASDFDVNPIGVKFNPEELIERHRNGEALASLTARPRIDPSQVMAQFPPPPDSASASQG